MKTLALVERGRDGKFGVYTPDLESTLIGEGDSVSEAMDDFNNSYREVVSSFAPEEIPQELQDLEFEFKYDVASIFDYFDWINVSRFAAYVGINPTLMHQYKKKDTYISRNQLKKIESALHTLGRELCSINL